MERRKLKKEGGKESEGTLGKERGTTNDGSK